MLPLPAWQAAELVGGATLHSCFGAWEAPGLCWPRTLTPVLHRACSRTCCYNVPLADSPTLAGTAASLDSTANGGGRRHLSHLLFDALHADL